MYIILTAVTQLSQHLYVTCKTNNEGYFVLLPPNISQNQNIRDSGYRSKPHPIKSYILRRLAIDNNIKKYFKHLSNSARDTLYKSLLREDIKEHVHNASVTEMQDEMEVLVENELLNALSKKASALLDRPYLQKKGRNDFLVIHPELNDPFVTIVPNDMYYNSEKKCVNWLDDCNRKGLRERLLQKVNSPY